MKENAISLEKQAFRAAFLSIVGDLSFCPANCHSASTNVLSDLKTRSAVFSCTQLGNPDFVRDMVRQRLDQTLVGVVSEHVRALFVSSFKNGLHSPTIILRPSAFLSCVLDQSFKQLEVIVTDPGLTPDLDVIPVIAKYAPMLETLELDFSKCSDSARDGFRSSLLSLHLLTELKELTVKNSPKAFDRELALVGRSCRKLQVLRLGLSSVSIEILNGIVEPCRDNHEVFRLPYPRRLPSNAVNPLCCSLRYLDLEGTKKHPFNRMRDIEEVHGVAIVLMNVPHLEHLVLSNLAVPEAIYLIRKRTEPQYIELKLEELLMVRLDDQPTLEAICDLCPHLKSISFVDGRDGTINRSKPMDPAIPKMLGKLTKVKELSFKDVNSSSLASVIQLWAGQLTTLAVDGNTQMRIPLALLATCSTLTEFSSGASIKFDLPAAIDDQQPFLPKLAKISISSCLFSETGKTLEQLLLLKPSLQHVELECCHLAETSRTWMRVFQQWRGLESLQIKSARGLEYNIIEKLRLWMPKLKNLILPFSLVQFRDSRGQSRELEGDYRTNGVNLDFKILNARTSCLDGPRLPSETEDDDYTSENCSVDDGEDYSRYPRARDPYYGFDEGPWEWEMDYDNVDYDYDYDGFEDEDGNEDEDGSEDEDEWIP